MTAQEAQNILQIESPFTTVELKSAHKDALLIWFPAQFMSDRAQLAKALDQTARIHEAYDVLLPLCEERQQKNANPWVEEALRQAYGQTPTPVLAPSALQETAPMRPLLPDPPIPASPEPAPRKEPALSPADVSFARDPESAARQQQEILEFVPASRRSTGSEFIREPVERSESPPYVIHKDAASASAPAAEPELPSPPLAENASAVPLPATNPFLHEIVPLKRVGAEEPKVELRGKSSAPDEQAVSSSTPASASAPSSSPKAGADPVMGTASTVTPRMETAITKVRPPKVVISPRLRGGAVSPAMPVVTVSVPLPPLATPVPVPTATPALLSAPVVVPLKPPFTTPAAEEVSAVTPSSPTVEKPAAETPSPASPAPAPKSTPAPAAAHHTSAVHAEEESAVELAAHHVPVVGAAPAAGHLQAPPAVPVARNNHATGAPGETKADLDSNEQLAGDHALVPALGDRYHPAERETSPNTDSSRHLPARPVAPSGTARSDGADAAGSPAASRSSESSVRAVKSARVLLSVPQKILRFVLAVVCIGAVGYGMYWLSKTSVGRDPWGSEPGSGGPTERVRQMAFEGLKRAAAGGNLDAQLAVGRAYQQGKDVAADPGEALKWFRKAAEQGSVEAQYAVGDAYKNGTGVPQDNAEALKWYRMAEAAREDQRKTQEKGKEKEDDFKLR